MECSKTDWNLCVVCQESKAETLQCPADSKRSDVGAGCKTLAENILQFNELECMPIQMSLARLDEVRLCVARPDGTRVVNCFSIPLSSTEPKKDMLQHPMHQ